MTETHEVRNLFGEVETVTTSTTVEHEQGSLFTVQVCRVCSAARCQCHRKGHSARSMF